MIRARALLILALTGLFAQSACDRPAARAQHRQPVPVPAAAADAPDAPVRTAAQDPTHQFPDDPPSPVQWNAAKSAFEYKGRPLRAEKVWTFDGATDGFVAMHGDVIPADAAGMSLKIGGRDTILRTPRGLNVQGANRSLVLVRLTRVKAARRLDPVLYYSTPAHGESQAWMAKPAFGGHPRLNDTVTMVFNMHRLVAGGEDWKTSKIDQLRLDLDDGPGGAFVIRQVAIAQDPGDLFPAPPAAPKAEGEKTEKTSEPAKPKLKGEVAK